MTEIAKAYVQIIPSMEGFNSTIKKTVEGEAGEAGKSSGGFFSNMFAQASQGGLKGFASAAGSAMVDLGKSALAGVAKLGSMAVAAAVPALADMGRQALEAYADYEQLAGGVETLFGTSSEKVMDYASKAYKTAGLSANDYMETVTSFSASLLQGLGGDTEKAATIADMAIVDMADNANKMGTSMESIQNAYQGFAKSNFTMLDNLKLGYGGTQAEMVRLINDSGILGTKIKDLNGITFDQMVQAIHVVQTNLGITGATAAEASTTIQGSVNAMKSAWQNLLVGIADDQADLDTLINNFVDSVITAGDNLIPRVETILGGLGTLISTAAQKLVPTVVTYIVNNLPNIVQAGVQLVMTLAGALIQALPQIAAAVPQIINAIITGLKAQWPNIKNAGRDVVNQLKDAITGLASSAGAWGRDLMDNFINGIKAKFAALRDAAASAAQTVRNFLGFSEPKEGPLSNFHTYAPDMMKLFAEGIYQNLGVVEKAMDGLGSIAASEVGGYTLGAPGYSAVRQNALPADNSMQLVTDVRCRFEGSLAQLAMILQPVVTAETHRVGAELVPT